MSPDTAAAVVSGVIGLIVALAAMVRGKDKAGIAAATQTPQAVVKALATGSNENVVVNIGTAMVALARTIAEQTERLTESEARITQLERSESLQQARIHELEAWGTWASDPPPRTVPPWRNQPERST